MIRKLLGRPIGEITQARVRRDPDFARALLQEAVQALLSDDLVVARSLICDAVKGTIGYATLSRRTGTPEKVWYACSAPAATQRRRIFLLSSPIYSNIVGFSFGWKLFAHLHAENDPEQERERCFNSYQTVQRGYPEVQIKSKY